MGENLRHKNRHTGRLFLELAQKKGFEAASIETFSIEAPDVKEVKAIEVSLLLPLREVTAIEVTVIR